MGSNIKYGIIVCSISLILTVIFLFSKATGFLTQNFYDVFFPITIGVTNLWAIVLGFELSAPLRNIFRLNESVPGSIPSRMSLGLKILIIGGGLSILFSAGAIGLGSPVIDIPQPFVQTAFSEVSEFDKVFYQAAIPGFFEESCIYLLVLALQFILLAMLPKRKNSFILTAAVSAVMGGLVLTQAHRIVYGSDSGAYIGVFIFETVVQFFNLYGGIFISWLPHMVHNAVVTLSFLVAFSVGGVSLMMPALIGKVKKCRE